MGWTLDIYVISGTILKQTQAERIYDQYIRGKKLPCRKGKRKREMINPEYEDIYCHPSGNDKEDDQAAKSLDFEECDFSISKSLELPTDLRKIFPHKVYLLSLRNEGHDDDIWCLYFKMKCYEMNVGMKVEEEKNSAAFQHLLNELDIKQNRLARLRMILGDMAGMKDATEIICNYYAKKDYYPLQAGTYIVNCSG